MIECTLSFVLITIVTVPVNMGWCVIFRFNVNCFQSYCISVFSIRIQVVLTNSISGCVRYYGIVLQNLEYFTRKDFNTCRCTVPIQNGPAFEYSLLFAILCCGRSRSASCHCVCVINIPSVVCRSITSAIGIILNPYAFSADKNCAPLGIKIQLPCNPLTGYIFIQFVFIFFCNRIII